LPGSNHDLFRRHGERQALPFAEGLRQALQGERHDRPVIRSAEVNLPDLAEKDHPLDRRREPIARQRGRGTDRQRLRADADRHGRAGGQRARRGGEPADAIRGGGRGLADQSAERRPHDHLAARADAFHLALDQVRRTEEPRDETHPPGRL